MCAVLSPSTSNFYPRPPRGGRRSQLCRPAPADRISIHALREEGDLLRAACTRPPWIFLSTPSARRATRAVVRDHECRGFLSTPSARRATMIPRMVILAHCISIHALREEGDQEFCSCSVQCRISIHALREEGDQPSRRGQPTPSDFYPRPPRGGRLLPQGLNTFRGNNFYPRPPRGGRPRK